MVPKVAGKGKSFKGAAAYYLHDKGADSSERVGFTATVNLPTQDPELAWRLMARTAAHQNQIKAAAGVARTGRKLQDPVYIYSLSWAPGEEVSQDQMLEAARQTLQALGLAEHQALIIQHTDEPHPHLHVMVNRVHPEHGKAARLGNDHLTLSRWAEAYEKRQGKVRIEQRVENNARRREGYVKHRAALKESAFRRWRWRRLEANLTRQQDERVALYKHQKDRVALITQMRAAEIAAFRQELQERMRPYWTALYQGHRNERSKITVQQHNARARLRQALKERKGEWLRADDSVRRRYLTEAFQGVSKAEAELAAIDRAYKQKRKELGSKVRRLEEEGLARIADKYRATDKVFGAYERAEWDALKDKQRLESEKRAAQVKRGGGRLTFEAGRVFDGARQRLSDLFRQRSAAERYELGPVKPEPGKREEKVQPASQVKKGGKDAAQESTAQPKQVNKRPGHAGHAPAPKPTAHRGGKTGDKAQKQASEPKAAVPEQRGAPAGDKPAETEIAQPGVAQEATPSAAEAALRDLYQRTLEDQERRARERSDKEAGRGVDDDFDRGIERKGPKG